MTKRIFAAAAVVFSVIAAVFCFNFLLFLNTPYGKSHELNVERGTSVSQIVNEMIENDVISNRFLFTLYIRLSGAGKKIHAGVYLFEPRQSPRARLHALLTGDFPTVSVTIPEGWTVRQIADYLGERGLVDRGLFYEKAKGLEGTLYPDTYQVYEKETPEELIKRMKDHFDKNYTDEFRKRAVTIGMTDSEVLILASIVEKETGQAIERPLIASVFHNRLKQKMALATDPTVIYGIENFNGNLTRADLERPGPYNSYLNAGLPPTPICNPGRDAIFAVLYPAETDYLYFVSKNDGTHHFSKTAAEHSRAVQQYQVQRKN